jgi:hypothetical protein
MVLTIIIIYISGYISSYLLNRWFFKKEFPNTAWTIGDRRFGLTISVVSWIAVMVIFLEYVSSRANNGDLNKKAKW